MVTLYLYLQPCSEDNGDVAYCPIPFMKPENTNVLNHIVCVRVGQ